MTARRPAHSECSFAAVLPTGGMALRTPFAQAHRVAKPAIAAAFALTLAACAGVAPPQEIYYFDESAMAPLPGTPMVEYPPIEPVPPAPIEPIEPTPTPMPEPVAETPAASPPTPAPVAAAVQGPADDPQPMPAGGSASSSADPPADAHPVSPAPSQQAAQERVVVAAIAPEPRAAPAPPPPDFELLALMADLNRYSALGPDDARREITVMTQAFNRERNDANRVRLAMLYTLTRAPQDDLRAMQLLDNVAKSGGPNGPIKHLAVVLQVQVSERTRAVRDETARANEAAQKLDALRQMERSLLRDRVSSGGGGGGGGSGGGGH